MNRTEYIEFLSLFFFITWAPVLIRVYEFPFRRLQTMIIEIAKTLFGVVVPSLVLGMFLEVRCGFLAFFFSLAAGSAPAAAEEEDDDVDKEDGEQIEVNKIYHTLFRKILPILIPVDRIS